MADAWVRVALGLAGAVALLGLVPLRIDVALVADALARRWRLRLTVGAAWGAPAWRLRLGLRRGRGPGAARRPGPRPRRRCGAGRAKATGEHAAALVGRVWRSVRVRRASLSIDLGSADAALTAFCCGAAWAVGAAALAALPGLTPQHAALRVRPRYNGGGRLALRASVQARLRLWQAAVLALSVWRV